MSLGHLPGLSEPLASRRLAARVLLELAGRAVNFGATNATDIRCVTCATDFRYVTNGTDFRYVTNGTDVRCVTCAADFRYVTNGTDFRYVRNCTDFRYVTNGTDFRYVTTGTDFRYVTNGTDFRYVTNGTDFRNVGNAAGHRTPDDVDKVRPVIRRAFRHDKCHQGQVFSRRTEATTPAAAAPSRSEPTGRGRLLLTYPTHRSPMRHRCRMLIEMPSLI